MGLGSIKNFLYGSVDVVDKAPAPQQERREQMKNDGYSNDGGRGYYNQNQPQGYSNQPQSYNNQPQQGDYRAADSTYPRIIPSRQQGEVTSLSGLVVFQAKGIEDVQKIIDYLNCGSALVVDFSLVRDMKNGTTTAQRILDFISGAIYAIDGTIGELSPYVYTLCPNGVNIVQER